MVYGCEVLPSSYNKEKCLAEVFFENFDLDDSVSW